MSDPIEPLLRELAAQPTNGQLLERVRNELISAGRISSLVKILEWWAKRVDDTAVIADGFSVSAAALYQQTQDEKVTRDLFEAALERAPAHEPPVQRYAHFLETIGDRTRLFQMLEEHADQVERSGDIARGAAAWKGLADTRRRLGDLDGAIMALSRAQSVAPRDVSILLALVDRYLERAQARPDRAAQDRGLAVDLLVRAAATEPAQGMAHVTRALDLDPSSDRALQAFERLTAALNQREREGLLVPRIETFLQLQEDPASHPARRMVLARAYEAEGRFDDALEAIMYLPTSGEVDALRHRLEQERDRRSRPRTEASVMAVLDKLENEGADGLVEGGMTAPHARVDRAALIGQEATRQVGAEIFGTAPPNFADDQEEQTKVSAVSAGQADQVRAAIAAAKAAVAHQHDESGVDEDAPTNALGHTDRTEVGPAPTRDDGVTNVAPAPTRDDGVTNVAPPPQRAPAARAPSGQPPLGAPIPGTLPAEPGAGLAGDSEELTAEVESPPAAPSRGIIPRGTPGGLTAPMDRVELPAGVQLRRETGPALGLYGEGDDDGEDDFLVRTELDVLPCVGDAKRASQGGKATAHIWRFRHGRGLGFETFTTSPAARRSKHAPLELKVSGGGVKVRLTKAGIEAQTQNLSGRSGGTHSAMDGSRTHVASVGEWTELKLGEALELEVGSMTFVVRAVVEHEAEQTVADAIPMPRWAGAMIVAVMVHLVSGVGLTGLLSTGVVSLEVEDRTREEIFAEAMLEPEPPPEPDEPPPPPRRRRPTPPSEQRETQTQVPESVRRMLSSRRASSSSGDVSQRLASSLAGGTPGQAAIPDGLPMGSNVDAVEGAPGSSVLQISGALAAAGGGPSFGTGGGSGAGVINTMGGSGALEGVSMVTAMGTGRVRGRVRNVSALTRVQGSLSRGEIQQVVNRASGRIQRCYERGLASQPNLSGRVVYSWTIAANGRASGVRKASGGLGNANVENCIAGVLRRLRFPRPRGGPVTVSAYPFIFSRAQ